MMSSLPKVLTILCSVWWTLVKEKWLLLEFGAYRLMIDTPFRSNSNSFWSPLKRSCTIVNSMLTAWFLSKSLSQYFSITLRLIGIRPGSSLSTVESLWPTAFKQTIMSETTPMQTWECCIHVEFRYCSPEWFMCILIMRANTNGITDRTISCERSACDQLVKDTPNLPSFCIL